MGARTKPDFYNVASASQGPKGNYTTAREMLNDLPSIVMKQYGKEGAATASMLVRRHKNGWGSSDRKWFERMVPFAANALRNPDLIPDEKATWEVVALVGWVVDAAAKGKRLES